MKVSVRGPHKQISKKEFRFAAQFMLRHMLEEEVHEKLFLTIQIVDMKKQNYLGLTKGKNSKNFTIKLDPDMTKPKTLRVLAHELVHVKQFVNSELGMKQLMRDGVPHTIWNSELFDETAMSHWDYPWEIEANGREEGLYQRYIEFVKTYNLNFDMIEKEIEYVST